MITSIFSRTKDFMGRLEQVLQATPYPLGPVQWLVQSLSSNAVYLEMSGKNHPQKPLTFPDCWYTLRFSCIMILAA